jgi:hypothetical protein
LRKTGPAFLNESAALREWLSIAECSPQKYYLRRKAHEPRTRAASAPPAAAGTEGGQRSQPRRRSGPSATEPSGPGAKLDPPDHTQPTSNPAPPLDPGGERWPNLRPLAPLIAQPAGWAPAGSLALVFGCKPTKPKKALPSPARPSDLGASLLKKS